MTQQTDRERLEPLRWLVTHTDGTESSRRTAPDEIEQAAYAKRGWTVTPLYAGAPAAETISAKEVARAVDSAILCVLANYSHAVANNGERFEMDTLDFHLRAAATDAVRAALSSLPTEEMNDG